MSLSRTVVAGIMPSAAAFVGIRTGTATPASASTQPDATELVTSYCACNAS